jgi:DUF1009 family protein
MHENRETIGLIAGGGQFPILLTESAKAKGHRVVVVAHLGETDPSLSDIADDVTWIKLGQLGKLIRSFKRKGIQKALMAGTITKKRMFEDVRLDIKGISFFSKLAIFHDDDILRAVAQELKGHGIEIVSSTSYLPELMAPQGCLTHRRPSKVEMHDIRLGWEVAKELGRLDIGQCVVVKNKTVLALEAIEGTNETILRGGRLAREKAVVVKVSKPEQDLRFDVPTIGLETVKIMSRIQGSVLAVEAGKTLVFDKQDMIALADKEGISIISCSETEQGPVM